MIGLLLASSQCPECGKWNFWDYGFDYETFESVSWCDDCDYEEREHLPEVQKQFETLKLLMKESDEK